MRTPTHLIRPGVKVGRLKVVEENPRSSPYVSDGKTWRCICTCGHWAIRTTAHLTQAIRRESDICCPRCRQRERRQHFEEYRKEVLRRIVHIKIGQRRGEIRTPEEIAYILMDRVAKRVLTALEEEFGPTEEETFSDDEIDPFFYDR